MRISPKSPNLPYTAASKYMNNAKKLLNTGNQTTKNRNASKINYLKSFISSGGTLKNKDKEICAPIKSLNHSHNEKSKASKSAERIYVDLST